MKVRYDSELLGRCFEEGGVRCHPGGMYVDLESEPQRVAEVLGPLGRRRDYRAVSDLEEFLLWVNAPPCAFLTTRSRFEEPAADATGGPTRMWGELCFLLRDESANLLSEWTELGAWELATAAGRAVAAGGPEADLRIGHALCLLPAVGPRALAREIVVRYHLVGEDDAAVMFAFGAVVETLARAVRDGSTEIARLLSGR